MFTSQMIVTGSVKPKEIVETFGVAMVTVKRYMRVYRQQGAKGFYESKPRHSSASKLKAEPRIILDLHSEWQSDRGEFCVTPSARLLRGPACGSWPFCDAAGGNMASNLTRRLTLLGTVVVGRSHSACA